MAECWSIRSAIVDDYGSTQLADPTPLPTSSVVVVVCFAVLGGIARAHRTPAQKRAEDFLVPTSTRAHVWPIEMKGTKRKQ